MDSVQLSTVSPRTARRSTEPGPALSRSAVIDRAVAIADAEGLEAVTIRRVATELGVTPMALYWHVHNKDELLAALGDRLYEHLDISLDPAAPWQQQLRHLADALLAALTAHPRLAPLAGARVLANDNGRRLTETALALLESAGFSVAEAALISRRVLHTIVTVVIEQQDLGDGLGESTHAQLVSEKRAALAALPAQTYPHLLAAVDDLTSCEDKTAYYTYSLDLLQAGITQLAARGSG
jgi:AcrR family transcriptional regulator